MRQAFLSRDGRVVRSMTDPCCAEPTSTGTPKTQHGHMMQLLADEEPLAFHAVLPHGSVLKCISELLMRCAPHVPLTVDGGGLAFVACDPATGRLIHIALRAEDLLEYDFRRDHPLRCTLESGSMHAVFHQLKKKDVVLLYATASGRFGTLVGTCHGPPSRSGTRRAAA